MDFLMYAFMVGAICYGMYRLLRVTAAENSARIKAKRIIDSNWDEKFLDDVDRWKRDRGSGV